jgi:hypothetical protein
MPQRWPDEIENAMARAVIDGKGTADTHRAILDGTLPGLSRAYELPKRTFYEKLAKVRANLRRQSGTARTDTPILAEIARDVREAAPEALEAAPTAEQEPRESREEAKARAEYEARIARAIAAVKEAERKHLANKKEAEARARGVLADYERRQRERFTPSPPRKRERIKVRDPNCPWRVYTVLD